MQDVMEQWDDEIATYIMTVSLRIEYFRELIHALEYVNQDKDYVLRFPTHAMKQFEIIPRMQDLLTRVERAIADKKMRIEKEQHHEAYETDGTMKKERIHNDGQ